MRPGKSVRNLKKKKKAISKFLCLTTAQDGSNSAQLLRPERWLSKTTG
jgi:hypothetical protein